VSFGKAALPLDPDDARIKHRENLVAQKIRSFILIGMLLSLLGLAACSPAAPASTPTIDLDPFRTEVAATVLAQVTRDLASTPSVTPYPSPTATDTPTVTPSPEASPTATVSIGTPGVGTSDKAQWVSQSIADDTVFAPGAEFTMSWRLRNVGTTTWTAGYMLRYFSGDTFGVPAPREILIGQEVPPGGEIEINIPMKAPAKPGTYRSDWVMSTESRANFNEPVFLKIKVALPPTLTPTPVPPTLTPTPQS